ncbi:putative mitochondrial hypothetical protein [Leptomonas pyrrhocoris]|uniref:Uncharacterized protein n=1 Tax=Leptomonas pyrrhocoris TaxID=157538 RepID=A0A0M9GA30_LEPPY|nr:putative mitochondrial hypothetical protein [Leptomonas pyrrhocoris]KPA85746.1 putative mitochondrial hypothetical protein [Leptomonas pyrrhocoris]|eukprot:XP_015664185.1 putative mitochondrial hypothetical protein [Leptomonas pyrrhocoris]
MGLFSFSLVSAPTGVSKDAAKGASTASASTEADSESAPVKDRLPVKSKSLPIAQPILTEAEQLDLLVGGARLDDAEAKDKAAFLRSNKRHTYLDGFLSCAVYTFSGLQHIHGQSNALTLLTMWTVGTTFLVDAGERTYLQNALQGTLPDMQTPTRDETAAEQQQNNATATSMKGDENVLERGRNETAASVSTALSSTMTPAPVEAGKLAEQQRKIFLTQTVASWVWMLASFQQFKVHKRLKWCGYSSWMGLGCVSYFTTRHMYNLLVA